MLFVMCVKAHSSLVRDINFLSTSNWHVGYKANCIILLTQFYTFLETSLATLSLLSHFIAFFSDGEIPGTPGMVATTFLAFGEV